MLPYTAPPFLPSDKRCRRRREMFTAQFGRHKRATGCRCLCVVASCCQVRSGAQKTETRRLLCECASALKPLGRGPPRGPLRKATAASCVTVGSAGGYALLAHTNERRSDNKVLATSLDLSPLCARRGRGWAQKSLCWPTIPRGR